eukprot:1328648-Pleurochrysis_carterae.AAC.2
MPHPLDATTFALWDLAHGSVLIRRQGKKVIRQTPGVVCLAFGLAICTPVSSEDWIALRHICRY